MLLIHATQFNVFSCFRPGSPVSWFMLKLPISGLKRTKVHHVIHRWKAFFGNIKIAWKFIGAVMWNKELYLNQHIHHRHFGTDLGQWTLYNGFNTALKYIILKKGIFPIAASWMPLRKWKIRTLWNGSILRDGLQIFDVVQKINNYEKNIQNKWESRQTF